MRKQKMSSEIQENSHQNLKKTPLYEEHKKLNAKMIPFGGWDMPVQYPTGLVTEHKIVRSHVGLFDVSHMGEIEIHGQGSEAFLQGLTTNNLAALKSGQAQYNALCNEHGGVIDDIIIYKKNETNFFVCVNASNIQKDFDWISQHNKKKDISIENMSDSYGQIAVQGPNSRSLLVDGFLSDDARYFQNLAYYHFFEAELFGVSCLIARTGYTGELGYEIYCPTKDTCHIWNSLLNNNQINPALPCGLGARDTLRLEMGYLLYGNDMNENSSALECGLKWITKFEKDDFIGKSALMKQEKEGLTKRLVAFEMLDRAVGRHGYKVFHPENTTQEIGVVTSGSPSPSLAKNIGLMSVKSEYATVGTTVFIDIRGALKPAQIKRKPLYTKGTANLV